VRRNDNDQGGNTKHDRSRDQQSSFHIAIETLTLRCTV
jgi:hypothetical protein